MAGEAGVGAGEAQLVGLSVIVEPAQTGAEIVAAKGSTVGGGLAAETLSA